MVDVVARTKVKGTNFEIIVDCDKALEFKRQGKGSIADVLRANHVFTDSKKGLKASEAQLLEAFGSTDIYAAAQQIVQQGEIQLPLEYKKAQLETKSKQTVDWLARNCVNPRTGIPHPADRIGIALREAGVSIDPKKAVEEQAMAALKLIQKILPIAISMKKFAIKVPAAHIGKVYGLLKQYILKEEWLADGSLSCTVQIPAATSTDFFDKLNAATHGTALTQELGEK